MKTSTRAAFAACLLLLGLSTARAEAWPSLQDYVGKCVLIVKARAVDENGRISFEVVESWKGKYDPNEFSRTTTGGRFLATSGEHGLVGVDTAGQEVIFFFLRQNQPVEGKLSHHSTAFPVRVGKVTYASTSDDRELRKVYALNDFKKEVLAIAARAVRILTLGDSITKGVRKGVAADETFAALTEAALKEKGIAAEVINVGIGGEMTPQALARLEKEVIAKKPQIVTIMYGTNDSYVDQGKTEPRMTADEYRTHLTRIVEKLQEAGVKPVLMTEPRWGRDGKNGAGESPNRLLEKCVVVCRELAKEKKLPLVDHFADWTKAEAEGTDIAAWTTDQCHPNPAGHRRMADLMAPVLIRTVKGE